MSEQATVEIEEASNDTPSNAGTSAMTEAKARESGLSADEIEAGKKHGLIVEEKPAKKAGAADDKEDEKEEDAAGEDEGAEDAGEAEAADPKDAAEEDLDPEKEAELVKGYNDNEKSLYWKAKKERLKRQGAQRESEHTKIKLAAAEREIAALKRGAGQADDEEDQDDETDGENDDERVMTVGEFKKMLADQKKEQGKQNAEAQATIVRLEKQEEEFKADHPDFDEVMDLAKEMMDKKPSLRKMILLAGADANENAAEIAYDIGRMHPKYKQGGTKKVAEEAPAGSKNKVEKAITNADKRQSSASVSAGGTKRIVSEADLTVEDAAKLEPAAYSKLSQATRERLLRESCA